MGRILKPLVRGGGSYYPSKKWIPLVRNGGYTTQNGGETEPVWETVSGAIASFTTPFAYPLKKLVAQINPVQAGTGDPSPDNVRPISGWTGLSGQRCGKNLFDFKSDYSDWSNGYINTNGIPSGSAPTAPAYERTSPFIAVKGGQDYTLSYTPNTTSQLSNNCAFYDADKNFISGSYYGQYGVSQYTRTAPDNACYFRFSLRTYNSATEYQLEAGSSKTAYEAFKESEAISVTFPQTVYGGTDEVIGGNGTSEWAKKAITRNENFNSYNSNYGGVPLTISDANFISANPKDDVLCNVFDVNNRRGNVNGTGSTFIIKTWSGTSGSDAKQIIFCGTWTSIDEFKTWLDSNELYVVYRLATPQTFTHTGQSVDTLVGQNNVWVTSGDVEVTYRIG